MKLNYIFESVFNKIFIRGRLYFYKRPVTLLTTYTLPRSPREAEVRRSPVLIITSLPQPQGLGLSAD